MFGLDAPQDIPIIDVLVSASQVTRMKRRWFCHRYEFFSEMQEKALVNKLWLYLALDSPNARIVGCTDLCFGSGLRR